MDGEIMSFIVKKCEEEYCVFDSNEDMNVVAVCDVERISQKTCNLLNELNDENELLKQTNQELNDELQKTMGYLALKSGIERENKQLKQQNRGLQSELKIFKEDVEYSNKLMNKLSDENEQLKQFPLKLDNRIQKLEESLKALKEMETDDLNPQAVEDVATVIGISLNALLEFKKELKGDVE